MHWAPQHVNPMVALRTVACSDRWEEAWPQIRAQVRGAARARPSASLAPAGSAAGALAPVPVPPLTLPDEGPVVPAPAPMAPRRSRPPAADHPWRRARVGRAQRGAA